MADDPQWDDSTSPEPDWTGVDEETISGDKSRSDGAKAPDRPPELSSGNSATFPIEVATQSEPTVSGTGDSSAAFDSADLISVDEAAGADFGFATDPVEADAGDSSQSAFTSQSAQPTWAAGPSASSSPGGVTSPISYAAFAEPISFSGAGEHVEKLRIEFESSVAAVQKNSVLAFLAMEPGFLKLIDKALERDRFEAHAREASRRACYRK